MVGRTFKLEVSLRKKLARRRNLERRSVNRKKHIISVSIQRGYTYFIIFSYACVINFAFILIVDDQIVIDIVSKHIKQYESKGQSWIVQGFPRTKAQALALQKMGIIPDKFILLKCKPTASISRLKNNLLGINQ